MKKFLIITGSVIAAIALLFFSFSLFIGSQVVDGSTQLATNEETTGVSDSFFEKYGMDYNEFSSKYRIERVEITSTPYGHIIPADHIFAQGADADNDTVILVHGLGGNRLTTYPVAQLFLEQGYNVLCYDQRSSGENFAELTTFGYMEKFDLIDCINYIKELAPDCRLGVWGTSFGGATAAQAAGYEDTQNNIDFLILDCPVSSMEWMVTEEMKHMDIGIPVEYMTWCGNLANRLMLGFSYKDADAAAVMDNVSVPLLTINSKADELTPYFMGKDIHDAADSEYNLLWTVADSAHTEMWLDYNEEYRSNVIALLEHIEK